MNRFVLCALLLANLVLAGALLTDSPANQAMAQVASGSTQYTAITMKIGTDEDAQIFIDGGSDILFGVLVDDARKNMELRVFDAVNLQRDFDPKAIPMSERSSNNRRR